jgi:hypothetical protein
MYNLNMAESKCGPDTMHFESARLQEYIDVFNKNPDKYRVSLDDELRYELHDLNVLRDLNGVKYIDLSIEGLDYSLVYQLDCLECLSVSNLSYPIDMSKLKKLNVLVESGLIR